MEPAITALKGLLTGLLGPPANGLSALTSPADRVGQPSVRPQVSGRGGGHTRPYSAQTGREVPAEWHLVDRVVGTHGAHEIVTADQQGPESREGNSQEPEPPPFLRTHTVWGLSTS